MHNVLIRSNDKECMIFKSDSRPVAVMGLQEFYTSGHIDNFDYCGEIFFVVKTFERDDLVSMELAFKGLVLCFSSYLLMYDDIFL